MTAPIRTLHVDIEGGWGGSSRSLYQLVSRLDRRRVEPMIVHRQTGPLQEWYADLKIPTIHIPEIGSFVPRERKSAKIFLASLPRLIRLNRAAERICHAAHEHQAQLIHLNYEGLFLLAKKLKQRLALPIVCHHRAHLPENWWARQLVARLSQSIDYSIFISPQEENRTRALSQNRELPGTTVWNIAPPPIARQPFENPPKALYLGNVEWSKGADRLVDIATALNELNAPPLQIAIYGKPRQTGDSFIDNIQSRISTQGLENRIELKGFTAKPEDQLASALALIRPSRRNDPWGRDVIEATAFGVPVLATGNFDGVVEHAKTGYLYEHFDAARIADDLITLTKDSEAWQAMSAAASQKGKQVFGGERQLSQVTSVFENLVKAAN